ncbi:MAG: gamma-glutamyltransferase [Acidobacteriota bacterium]
MLIVLAPALFAGDRITGKAFATRSEVIAARGMAATSQPLATQAALDILKQGGNAVDAAIAANAVLTLVEPTGCGLGGDLYVLLWDPETRQMHGLNASGRAPASLTRAMLVDDRSLTRMPARGVLPVTVPGVVDGWWTLHQRFGRLPFAALFEPALRYAREGFPVSELIAYYWDRHVPIIGEYPNFAETFLIDGRAPRTGEIFRNPGFARTIEAIAPGGRDAFYTGAIARTMAEHVQEQGGFLTVADLAAHRSNWVAPRSVPYRGVDVWQLPPNGQGIAVLQMLRLLEPYDVRAMGFGSADWLHHLAEAKKLAFADRARFYADATVNDLPIDALISAAYADQRRKGIDPARAARQVDAGNPRAAALDDAERVLRDGDTIYLATADSDRMMVSLIQSNYRGMGSGITPPGLGFVLQNRGELFHLGDPDHPNAYAPRKRPFHTIIPGFATRGDQPWLAFGVMGGATQPQGQVQILANLLDFGMNLQEAGDAPRLVHTGSAQPTGEAMDARGGTVHLESGFAPEVVRALQRRGHRVGFADGIYGGYQAIRYDPEQGVFYGASESRKDGQAAGY